MGNMEKIVGDESHRAPDSIKSKAELRKLYIDLEKRVNERTESLEKANQAKEEFLAVLSHELRTPLNVILGWTETLSEPNISPEIMEKGLKALRRSALIQKNLIADLLETSRIIAGKLRIEKRLLNLVALIREILPAFTTLASTHNIHLRLQSNLNAAWILGDEPRIHQILSNLISNSIKFTAENGEITISVEKVESNVEISVIDTGIGINPDFLPLAFDRFRQESIGTNRQHGGLGLGLAITQNLVHQHEGSIRAHSDGRDKGSTFTISFPLQMAPTQTVVVPKSPEQISLADRTVLLVDDAPDILYLLSMWLKKHSAKVFTAESVSGAMEILENHRPDVIFCDIGMPEQDGFDFIKQLREHTNVSLREIPVAALTAYAEDAQRVKTFASGFQRHLVKPISSEKFLLTVKEMLV